MKHGLFEKIEKLSIVTKTSILIVFFSIMLLFVAGFLFMQSQDNLIKQILENHQKDALELIRNKKEENLFAMRRNVSFNTKVISNISSSMLYNVDNVALELSLKPFMEITEIVAVKIVDNLSNAPFVVLWKDKNNEVFAKSHSELPKEYLGGYFSFESDINYNSKVVGKTIVYYTDIQILSQTEELQKSMIDKLSKFQKEIDKQQENSSLYQMIGFMVIVSVLVVVVIMSFNQLEQKIQERTNQLEEKNDALSETLNELQNTQKQLVESEKMASLGGLVAGVAHEINTPVGIGITAASHLDEKANDFLNVYKDGKMKRSELEKFVETSIQSSTIILSNLNRAAELIQSFKQVAVDQSSEETRAFKVKSYLEEILLSLKPKLKKTRHAVTVSGDEYTELNTYAGAFSQVFTNLIMNSIIHAYEPEDSGNITIDFKQQENVLSIVYKDDGKGIPEENMKKIFEPFFTTRRGQGGSGLGLHIIYNIVTQKMGGTLTCESQVGIGTTFFIDIPVSKDTQATALA